MAFAIMGGLLVASLLTLVLLPTLYVTAFRESRAPEIPPAHRKPARGGVSA
jgi:Cu/Ag efflux pump CusA